MACMTLKEYRAPETLRALMVHAEAAPALPALVKLGNSKLGAHGTKAHALLVVSGLAGHDCPGRSAGCDGCYAERFRYLMAATRRQGAAWAYSYLARFDRARLVDMLTSEIRAHVARLPKGSRVVVRIHEAGDFISPEHAHAWGDVIDALPEVQFYGYSRSWSVPAIAAALRALNTYPNAVIRRSHDNANEWMHDNSGAPGAFISGRVARVVKGVTVKPADVPRHVGAVTCPEQLTGGKVDCASCGICWEKTVPVQFLRH